MCISKYIPKMPRPISATPSRQTIYNRKWRALNAEHARQLTNYHNDWKIESLRMRRILHECDRRVKTQTTQE